MVRSNKEVLEQYDISHYGFLPVEEPLARLPQEYYQPWENIMSNLEALIASKEFYNEIKNLEILDTSLLQNVPEWRRAYVILTFFTHAHIWTASVPVEVLPPNIARPLISVSNYLGLPPTATYPALSLWNCALKTPHSDFDLTNPDNVIIQHTFTGTEDEKWFYAISVAVEAQGINAISLMLSCIDAVDRQDDEEVAQCLNSFTNVIVKLGQTLNRMHERNSPAVFYHQIRPFLAGSKGMEKAGLPQGVFYDEGNGAGSWRQYSGGSNAQSTLIQFLDIALGVKHESTGSKAPADPVKRQTFINEMRNYMPRQHREFLEHFSQKATIRTYALSAPPSSPVAVAFDGAVKALTAFRDIHIRIVARYIIATARVASTTNTPSISRSGSSDSVNKASEVTTNIASSSAGAGRQELTGTGGTNLITFLKQTRDETRAAGTTVGAGGGKR